MQVKRCIIDQIEIAWNGYLQIRIYREDTEDGHIVASSYHRTGIVPGGDIDATFIAVNNHLNSLGWPSLSTDEISKVRKCVSTRWTPEIIAAYKKAVDDANAAEDAANEPTELEAARLQEVSRR